MPIFDGFLAVFSLAVGFFTGGWIFHWRGGRSVAVGIDAVLPAVSANAPGIDIGSLLPGSVAGLNVV